MKADEISAREIVKEFFEKATKTDTGKELINMYDFAFQFHVTDGEDFYLEIKNGKYTVEKGECPEKNVEHKTLVEGSAAGLTDVFKGQSILWDCVWNRKLKAECYGPSQGYVSWLSQFLKIGRREKFFSEYFTK